MKEITTRTDISLLVHTFYDKIRQEPTLGPIFNHHIAEEEWPAHLEKLTDFWESNLMGVQKFRGNPTAKHAQVDAHMNYSIDQTHFAKWLNLWFSTIDELFEGEKANQAKHMARKMSTGQFLAIWRHRPENQDTH